MIEKRRHERHLINRRDMRIYTHIKGGCYSVIIKDIGIGGAFVTTPFLPKEGEIITYEILDRMFKPLHTGNGTVSRLKSSGTKDEHGFGIMFSEKLDDKILNLVTGH